MFCILQDGNRPWPRFADRGQAPSLADTGGFAGLAPSLRVERSGTRGRLREIPQAPEGATE